MEGTAVRPAERSIQHENILQLRRYLNLSQSEFIDCFMTDSEGKRGMSNASLSNIESKGKGSVNKLVANICTKMSLNPSVFTMETEKFIDQLPELVGDRAPGSGRAVAKEKKKQINLIVEKLTQYFADQMLEGKLKKGDQIPTDRELAGIMGVGRTNIREALKVLDIMGMIDIRPGQGTFITGAENDFFMIPLSWSLFMNAEQIDEILEVRDTLEEKSAYLAAVHQNPSLMKKLSEIMDEMGEDVLHEDIGAFSKTDTKFHYCISELSENRILHALRQTISSLIHEVSETGLTNLAQMQESYREHQKIYAAILEGDGEHARIAMLDHLKNAHHRYHYTR